MKTKTARGSLAMGLATLASRPIAILAMVVLARLLDPEDFGLIALAMVLFSTANLFSGLGMGQAVIQSRREVKEIAFPAFATTAITSVILMLVIYLGIDGFAGLLGNRELAPILLALSPMILFDTLALVPDALLRRELSFGKVGLSQVVMNVVTNVVAIALAFTGFGLWSLVWGNLLGSITRMIMMWMACPGWVFLKPHRINRQVLDELLRYGVKATSGGLVDFVNSNWDDWFVGRTMGAAALGFYDKAYNLTNGTIAGLNRGVLNGVFMPSYAKMQDDPRRLSNVYLKALSLSAVLMAPLSMGVFAVANELVPFMFGDKWIPMIPVLQIFSFMALIRPLAASTSPLFRAVGRPEYDVRGGLVVLAVMVPLVLGLRGWSIEGVAVAVVVSYAAGLAFNVYQLGKLLPDVPPKMWGAVMPSLVASALMVIAVVSTRQLLNDSAVMSRDGMALVVLITVGGVVFTTSAYLMQRQLIHEMLQIFRTVLGGSRFRIGRQQSAVKVQT